MKIRIISGAVIAAAALALPAVAHAATYAPVSASDPAYTEGSDEPANSGIDITNVRGYRSDTQLTVATKFRNLKSVPYSRRIVALIDPTTPSGNGRILEYRTGPKGNVNVAIYAFNFGGSNSSLKQVSCSGLKATVSATTDKLTFVLPAACYPGAKSDGAYFFDQAASYTAESWNPGPLDVNDMSSPDQQDGVQAIWDWSGDLQAPRPPAGRKLLF